MGHPPAELGCWRLEGWLPAKDVAIQHVSAPGPPPSVPAATLSSSCRHTALSFTWWRRWLLWTISRHIGLHDRGRLDSRLGL